MDRWSIGVGVRGHGPGVPALDQANRNGEIAHAVPVIETTGVQVGELRFGMVQSRSQRPPRCG